MVCLLCKIQYARKTKTAFNLRLHNHWKDTKKRGSILTCNHFQQQKHNFIDSAKIIIINKPKI